MKKWIREFIVKIKPWKTWPRRHRALIVLPLLFLALFLSGYVIIKNSSVQSYLKKEIITAVEKDMDASLKIGEIDGNPFSYLRLKQIDLQGPYKSEEPKNHIKASEVFVRFSLWQLLKGRVGFSRVYIKSPEVYLDTKVLLSHKTVNKKKGSFELGWLDIYQGNVTLVYLDKAYDIQNAVLQGSLSVSTSATVVKLRNFDGTVEGLKIDRIRGRVSFSPNRLEVNSLQIQGKDIRLDVNALMRMDPNSPPYLILQAESPKLPVDKIFDFIPKTSTPAAKGTARFKVKLSGQLDRLVGEGEISSLKGELGGMPYSKLNAHFSVNTSHIEIDKASIQILKGMINAQAEAHIIIDDAQAKNDNSSALSRLNIPFVLKVGLGDIDLTQIPKIDPTMSGNLSGNVKLEGALTRVSTWRGNGSFKWAKGTYRGVQNMAGRADLSLVEDNLYFKNVLFTSPGMDCKGNIDVLRVAKKNSRLEFKFDFTTQDFNNQKTILHFNNVSGAVKGTLHGVSDQWRPLLVDGKFQVGRGRFESLKFSSAEGIIHADRKLDISGQNIMWLDQWPIASAKVNIQMLADEKGRIYGMQFISIDGQNGQTQVKGKGTVDFRNQKMLFGYTGVNGRLEDLPVIQGFIPMFGGRLNVDGTVTGWGNKVVVSNKYTLTNPTVWKNGVPEAFKGDVVVAGPLVSYTVTGSGFDVRGTVENRKPESTMNMTAILKNARWNSPEGKGIEGNVNGNIQVNGRLSSLQLRGQLDNSNLRISEAVPVHVTQGTLQGSLLDTFKRGMVDCQIGSVHSKALSRNWNFPEMNVGFQWNNPHAVDIQVDADSGAIEKDQLSRFKMDMTYQFDREYLEFKDIRTGIGSQGAFDLKGYLDLKSKTSLFRANMVGRKFPIEQIWKFWDENPPIGGLSDFDVRWTSQGFDMGNASFEGTLGASNLSIVTQPGWSNAINLKGIDRFDVNINGTNGLVKLQNGKARIAGTDLTINGTLESGKPMNLKIKGDIGNLGSILNKGGGLANIDLILTGTRERPRINGNIILKNGRYDLLKCQSGTLSINLNDKLDGTIKGDFNKCKLGSELFDTGSLRITMKDPVIKVDGFQLTRKDSLVKGQGTIHSDNGQTQLDLTARKIILTRWLTTKPSAWLEDSRVDLDAEFNGNYKTQQGTYYVKRIEGSAGSATLNLREPVKVSWKNDAYDISPFIFDSHVTETKKNKNGVPVAGNGGGTLSGQGQIRYKGNDADYAFTIKAKKFAWPIFKGIDALYDADINLNDKTGKMKMTGDVKLYRTNITTVVSIDKLGGNNPNRITSLPELPFQMDMKLSADSAVFFHNDLLNLEARGWAKLVTNSSNELEVSYELKTLGGAILYRNKQFPITRAELRNTDPRVFNPYIEAEARTRIRSIDIFLRVFGPLNNYDINLTSDPPYSQSDLLALLATGRTVVELKELEKGITPEVAAGYAGEQILNTLGSPVVKAVGIDNVAVEYDEVDSETKLKIEKKINNRIKAGYNLGLSKESKSNAEVEVNLNKNLSVVGRVGVNSVTKEANGSVDLEIKIPTR